MKDIMKFDFKNPTRLLWSEDIKVYRKNLGLDRDIIVKRQHYHALSNFKPTHNNNGQRTCLNCRKIILDKRKRKYCSDTCSSEFFAHHNSAAMRTLIFNRDNFTCKKCGTAAVRNGRLTDPYSTYNYIVDHIKPIALGGAEFDENNLQLLCGVCNREKTKNDQAKIAKKRAEIRLLRNPFEVSIKFLFVQEKSLFQFLALNDDKAIGKT